MGERSIASEKRRYGMIGLVVGLALIIPCSILIYGFGVKEGWVGVGWIIGALLLIFVAFGQLSDLWPGESETLGRHIVSYICPHCHTKIRLEHIPSKDGVLFTCPHCGRLIVSKRGY